MLQLGQVWSSGSPGRVQQSPVPQSRGAPVSNWPPFSNPAPPQPLIAVRVKDGLFVGNSAAARDGEFLSLNKVSHVINCCAAEVPNVFAPQGVAYLSFAWRDAPGQLLFDHDGSTVRQVSEFIDRAVSRGECCLVHSFLGKSRSCALVAAYLVHRYGWELDSAVSFLTAAHPEMCVKPFFHRQLRALARRRAVRAQCDVFHPLIDTSGLPMDDEQWVLRNSYLNSLPLTHHRNAAIRHAATAPTKHARDRAAPGRRRIVFTDTGQGTNVAAQSRPVSGPAAPPADQPRHTTAPQPKSIYSVPTRLITNPLTAYTADAGGPGGVIPRSVAPRTWPLLTQAGKELGGSPATAQPQIKAAPNGPTPSPAAGGPPPPPNPPPPPPAAAPPPPPQQPSNPPPQQSANPRLQADSSAEVDRTSESPLRLWPAPRPLRAAGVDASGNTTGGSDVAESRPSTAQDPPADPQRGRPAAARSLLRQQLYDDLTLARGGATASSSGRGGSRRGMSRDRAGAHGDSHTATGIARPHSAPPQRSQQNAPPPPPRRDDDPLGGALSLGGIGIDLGFESQHGNNARTAAAASLASRERDAQRRRRRRRPSRDRLSNSSGSIGARGASNTQGALRPTSSFLRKQANIGHAV